MYIRLPRLELAVYSIHLTICLGLTFYNFYQFCRKMEKDKHFADWALEPGFFLNFKYREKFGAEVPVMMELGQSFLAIGFAHIILRRIIFRIFIRPGTPMREEALSLFLALFGFFGISHLIGYVFTSILLVIALINYVAILYIFPMVPVLKDISQLWRAWIVIIMQTMLIHNSYEAMEVYQKSLYSHIAFLWGMGWYDLHLVSYMHSNPRFGTGILQFLAYVLYFPTFVCPFVTYERFVYGNELVRDDERSDLKPLGFGTVIVLCLKKYLVVSVWTVLTVFANHAFFPTAIAFYPEVYDQMNPFARSGHAMVLGQYFQAKYMLLYGAPWLITLLDTGAPIPDIPVFIGRVYRYSVMWRRFDTGMYEFMRDHLYVPFMGKMDEWAVRFESPILHSVVLKRSIALAVVYIFVGLWHGQTAGVQLFAFLNFVGLTAEYLGSVISRKLALPMRLHPLTYRRLSAICYLFVVNCSWLSFFVFVTDLEIGTSMIRHIYDPASIKPIGYFAYAIGFFGMYCWVQLSMELELLLDGPPTPRIRPPEPPKAEENLEAKKQK